MDRNIGNDSSSSKTHDDEKSSYSKIKISSKKASLNSNLDSYQSNINYNAIAEDNFTPEVTMAMTRKSRLEDVPAYDRDKISNLIESIKKHVVENRFTLSTLPDFTVAAKHKNIVRSKIGSKSWRVIAAFDKENLVMVIHVYESRHDNTEQPYTYLNSCIANKKYIIM